MVSKVFSQNKCSEKARCSEGHCKHFLEGGHCIAPWNWHFTLIKISYIASYITNNLLKLYDTDEPMNLQTKEFHWRPIWYVFNYVHFTCPKSHSLKLSYFRDKRGLALESCVNENNHFSLLGFTQRPYDLWDSPAFEFRLP